MTTNNQNASLPPFRETVLIVDDDPHIREVIRFAMHKAGFKTCEAEDGHQCLEEFQRCQPDIIILDILMPEMDGNEVCAKIRAESNIPIIFLSSMDDEVDRIIGLESGGDDYVTKPFSPRELVARVNVILRRVSANVDKGNTRDNHNQKICYGHLTLDPERFLVFWAEEEITLTATEFALVRALANSPGRVFSREELRERTYTDAYVSDRTIDSHIRKIRRKFRQADGEPIETIRGIGYKLGPCQ